MDEAIGCVADYEALARAALDPSVWHYLSEGDSAGNERALSAVQLMPRPLRDLRGGHTRLQLFGQNLAHPMVLAPMAYQRLFHPDGEVASALAASAQGGAFVISSLASQPLEAIAEAARGDEQQGAWFQLYWQGTRESSLRLLQRAEQAGCAVVMLTVDAPIKQASLVLPPDVGAVNLPPRDAPADRAGGVFDGWMAQAPTWDDLAWLRRQTRLPLLVKGLLHPADAQAAVDAGCDGVVVSNHGGRVLRGTPASLHALSAVVGQLRGRVPVLLDSGIRSGRDVFVALAHGAAAVLVGRPCLWGLAAQGPMGVAHVIRLLRDELEMTMALTGCLCLADVGPARAEGLAPGSQ